MSLCHKPIFWHLGKSDILCLILFLLPHDVFIFTILSPPAWFCLFVCFHPPRFKNSRLWSSPLASFLHLVSKPPPLFTGSSGFLFPTLQSSAFFCCVQPAGPPEMVFAGSMCCTVRSRAAGTPGFPTLPLLALCQAPLRASSPAVHSVGRELLRGGLRDGHNKKYY